MQLEITHETHYAYQPAVETAQHVAHLRPPSTDHQQLLSHTLKIGPTPSQLTQSLDVYGNLCSFFSLQAVHEHLSVVARSLVRTSEPVWAQSSLSWEQVRERFRYRAAAQFNAASEFVFASPYVPRHADFVAYARPSFGPGVALLAAARDLMERIHLSMTYESESTEVNTPALEALQQGKGVCQDFAHIMVACFRAMGLPARYVSGYLLTHPAPGQPRLIGSDASHAWASVYVPDQAGDRGWCDFDPTNNRMPGEDYVTLATGRDYSDVSPMRGVIHGGASHTLSVAVTVMPIEPTPEEFPAPDEASQSQRSGTASQSQSEASNWSPPPMQWQ